MLNKDSALYRLIEVLEADLLEELDADKRDIERRQEWLIDTQRKLHLIEMAKAECEG